MIEGKIAFIFFFDYKGDSDLMKAAEAFGIVAWEVKRLKNPKIIFACYDIQRQPPP